MVKTAHLMLKDQWFYNTRIKYSRELNFWVHKKLTRKIFNIFLN